MFRLFLTDEVIDARREAQMLHEVCDMTNGDKRDAQLMRSALAARENWKPQSGLAFIGIDLPANVVPFRSTAADARIASGDVRGC